jgi:hypothetical protein
MISAAWCSARVSTVTGDALNIQNKSKLSNRLATGKGGVAREFTEPNCSTGDDEFG